MNNIIYMKPEALIGLLFAYTVMQEEMINSQKKVIELQQRIDSITPKPIVEKDEFWHIASGGVLSEEAAKSEDLAIVKKFKDWNVSFAQKNLKPYLNPQVYSETLNQMTRGLPARIAELESIAEIEQLAKASNKRVLQLDTDKATDQKESKKVAAAR